MPADSRLVFAGGRSRCCGWRGCAPRDGSWSISDISVERLPAGPLELVSAVTQLWVLGMRRNAAMTASQIAGAARAAGFTAVDITPCGDRVIAPALRLVEQRLRRTVDAPAGQQAAARVLHGQAELLWRRRIIEYVLVRAVRP
jgi:hypothetical protein